MNATTVNEIEEGICADCVMMLANGELGQGDAKADLEHAEKMAALWGPGELTQDYSDGESWFSWSACGGCGSTLGGDRYAASWFEPTTEKKVL
jgi:hypothetical protein